jgi:ORF6N domain
VRELLVDDPLDFRDIILVGFAEDGPPTGLPLGFRTFSGQLIAQGVEKKRLDGLTAQSGASFDLAIEFVRQFDGRFHTTTIKPYLWVVKESCRAADYSLVGLPVIKIGTPPGRSKGSCFEASSMAKRKAIRATKPAAPTTDQVDGSILVIRGKKVLLDEQLAAFYGVETKRVVEAVKRNNARFPDDFTFQLNREEWEALRSQFATSSLKAQDTTIHSRSQTVTFVSASHGGRRYPPYAFTESKGSRCCRAYCGVHGRLR